MKPEKIEEGVFLLGGVGISNSRDCMVYLLDVGELVLIDTDTGP